MSMMRRIQRQARRNVQSGLIRRAQLTGKRKKMARRFLKRRDKNEREARNEKREAKPATWKHETHAATGAPTAHVAGETLIVETAASET
mgnify:CR=1 FL=1